MAGGGGGDGKTPTLNVVSMVDVIFNVIVFFIITAKAANDEMVKMVVPMVDTPNMHPAPKDVPRLIVSVVSDDPELFDTKLKTLQGGELIKAMEMGNGYARKVRVGSVELKVPNGRYTAFPALTAEITKAKAERLHDQPKDVKLEVLLRADLALPYEQVRPIMTAISLAGIENINLMGYQK